MTKVKPTWICQNCQRAFTTKYSLCRHFKRFPAHAPANLHDGADLKPITVTIDENVRTVQVVHVSVAAAAGATTPYGHHQHGTRNKGGKGKQRSSHSSAAKAMRMTGASAQRTTTNRPVPVSAESHSLPVVEETPPPPHFGTPSTDANTGTSTAFHPTTNGGFPFLPPFLEDDQILDIATPQQHQSSASETPASREPLSPMAAHYSWMFTKDTTAAGPGGDLLSPLAPACNYGQVFSEEVEEKLQQLAKKQNAQLRSPVELADLDQSLLLGDEEATSPFAFLEKTSSTDPILPKVSSLDFLSPGYSQRRSAAASVSLEDLDFGFAF